MIRVLLLGIIFSWVELTCGIWDLGFFFRWCGVGYLMNTRCMAMSE